MKIKVIKKADHKRKAEKSFFESKKQAQLPQQLPKMEEKVVQNIMNWVDELRKKKRFEIARSQTVLSSFR